jgi:DNA/RNA endonuclease YhcR with UshA esterase domain
VNEVKTKKENNEDSIISIKEISDELIDKRVTTKGTITSRSDHKDGHVFLTIEDKSGTIKVAVFSDKNISKDPLITGNVIQVSGGVDKYEGEIEIIPERETDIKLASTSAKITENQVGQQVDLVGKIVSKYGHPEGHIFLYLQLDGQEITVPLFESIHSNSDDYLVNSIIKVHGKVNKYTGEIQIAL